MSSWSSLLRRKTTLCIGLAGFAGFMVVFSLVATAGKQYGGFSSVGLQDSDPVLHEEGHSLKDSMLHMQKENARLEAELKYEKLKMEMLQRDMEDKKKAPEAPPGKILSPGEQTFLQEQDQRKATIAEVCEDPDTTPGLVGSLITGREGLTYCDIRRVGRSFWLKIYRYLNRDYLGDHVESPFDIGTKEAVERPFGKTKLTVWSVLNSKERQKVLKSKIFVAVEDPYLRLWLTYIDELVLPNKWISVGSRVEKMRKSAKIRLNRIGAKFCGTDITFEEFIQFATKAPDPEYAPYHRQCDPCQLKPTYVVKEETAKTDNEHVLKEVGLGWLMTHVNYTDTHVLKDIEETVTDSFIHLRESQSMGCGSASDFGKRLWMAFESLAFIPAGVIPPIVDPDTGESKLLSRVTLLFNVGRSKGFDRHAQMRKLMLDAYKSLSRGSLEAIQKKYDMDFKLFGYDREPWDIFSKS